MHTPLTYDVVGAADIILDLSDLWHLTCVDPIGVLVYLCPGCQNWSLDPNGSPDLLDVMEDHRAECTVLDVLAGLRLPLPERGTPPHLC